jgi:hypothetical protein
MRISDHDSIIEIVKIGLSTPRALADVFVMWSPHVQHVNIRVFLGGWVDEMDPDLEIYAGESKWGLRPAEALAKLKAFLEAANVAKQ